jgi:hypothetical protein
MAGWPTVYLGQEDEKIVPKMIAGMKRKGKHHNYLLDKADTSSFGEGGRPR